MIVSALAPSEIVIVGELTRLWPIAFPIIDSELRRFLVISVPRLRTANDPDKARLRSAVALVMNERSLWFFSSGKRAPKVLNITAHCATGRRAFPANHTQFALRRS